ncbi:MAG: hypothetical protein V4614_12065 [Pseudomonadota bacterium]
MPTTRPHASLKKPSHKTQKITILAALACGACAALAPVAAHAEPSPALDRASISFGAFNASPTLKAGVNTNLGRLDTGDVERRNITMPRVKADLLLFDSQGLSFDYYQFRRDYGGTLASNTTIGGGQVNTTGTANLNVQIDFAKLAYKWWFGSGNTVLGLGAGAAYYQAKFNFLGTASLNGATGAVNSNYSDHAYAPLLEVGVRHAFSENLRVFADASGISKGGGTLNGNIYNAAVGVEWYPVKNVGLVLDYGMTDINIKRNDGSAADLKIRLVGPSAFVKVRF